MKKIIVMMMVIGALSSFRGMEENPRSMKALAGYKLKAKSTVFNDFNLWVITNQPAFDNTFEAEYDSVLRPQFENEWVLAGKAETLNSTYRLRFKKTSVSNGILNVYFTVVKSGPSQQGDGPVSLVLFPKTTSVKKVNYYHDNVLVRSVPIVTVY